MALAQLGLVFDIRRYSVHDGPGIRTTVFFKGCPLACEWCHNPEGRTGKVELLVRKSRCIQCKACEYLCHRGALTLTKEGPVIDREKCDACGECVEDCCTGALELAGRTVEPAQLITEILKDRLFFEQSHGGVTFSGGEPLRQVDFLEPVIRECAQQGIHTAVDTCGYTTWESFEAIIPHTDLFLYDFKLADSQAHRLSTGVPNGLILSNLRKLSSLGKRIWVRIPLIPGITDGEANIHAAGEFLSSLPQVELVELLPYHAAAQTKYEGLGLSFNMENIHPPSKERVDAAAAYLRNFGLRVKSG